MRDTPAEFASMVDDFHRRFEPIERMQAAASMFESARRIVEGTLGADLTREERRRRWAIRMYGDSLSPAAIAAYSRFKGDGGD